MRKDDVKATGYIKRNRRTTPRESQVKLHTVRLFGEVRSTGGFFTTITASSLGDSAGEV
jgi:hypothetical protein